MRDWGVIESLGSSHWCTGASKGPNFDEFKALIGAKAAEARKQVPKGGVLNDDEGYVEEDD